jgi:hypothetical protein
MKPIKAFAELNSKGEILVEFIFGTEKQMIDFIGINKSKYVQVEIKPIGKVKGRE